MLSEGAIQASEEGRQTAILPKYETNESQQQPAVVACIPSQ